MTTTTKPEQPLLYDEVRLPTGQVVYSVTQQLMEPSTAPHVRAAAIYIPRQKEVPILSFQIVAAKDSSEMTVTSVKINDDVGGYMQIAVHAQQIPPTVGTILGAHYCNIVAIGFPQAGK